METSTVKELEQAIVWSIDQIIQLARKIQNGDPQKSLKDENLANIVRVLWEAPKVSQQREVAYLSGYLTSLFDLKEALGLKLNNKIEVYKSWGQALSQ